MTSRTRGQSLEQIVEDLAPYLIGWRGYFGFCQTPRVLTHLETWYAGDYARISGGSGETAITASRNCAAVASRSSMRRSQPAHQQGVGACHHTRRSRKPCATMRSMISDSPGFMSPQVLNPSNRRGTDPYARWCGRGGAARRPPIPIIGLYRGKMKPPMPEQLIRVEMNAGRFRKPTPALRRLADRVHR